MGARQLDGIPLSRLVEGLVRLPPGVDPLITGLALDSRRVGPGNLFLAFPGERSDGRRFIDQAIAAGAAAVLCEAGGPEAVRGRPVPVLQLAGLRRQCGEIAARFFGRPSRELSVIGVTGTNGKSTVTHLIATALSRRGGPPCGLIGTLGHGAGAVEQPSSHTTPDAVELQSILAGLLARGCDSVALEVSSHALSQHRVAGIDFDLAVFTNLSRDHLDYHPDMAAYAAAKRQLFELPGLRQAVVNLDDPFGQDLWRQRRLPLTGYSLAGEPPAGRVLVGRIEQAGAGGLSLTLQLEGELARLHSPLLGRFNAANLLAAAGALAGLGLALEQATALLSGLTPPPGRMEPFTAAGRPLVVVDYAHTPDALAQALRTLRPLCQGRLWCLFGCGGERDTGKRPQMGAVAAGLADEVVLTSDNPRGEEPEAILAAIHAGIPAGFEAVSEIPDRAEAIAFALQRAAPGDVVLVAGKGHETCQEIGGRRRPFSDRALVRELLEEAER